MEKTGRMQLPETFSAEAPAKINLGLRILSRRSDGYHEIETGLVAIDWCDRITVGLADSVSMTCNDRRLPTDEGNLCVQVALEMKRRYDVDSGIHIHLEKQIPFGAGLGGGSSDAATTIRLLSRMWSLDLPDSEQYKMAEQIGSDVPFFVHGKPAIGKGRGERLSEIELPSILPYLWLGIVNPDIVVSTANAYDRVTAHNFKRGSLKEILSRNDINSWRTDLENDFEESIFEMYPDLAVIKNGLYHNGAIYASLSGSGAAIYCFFESKQQTVKAMNNNGLRTWIGRVRL